MKTSLISPANASLGLLVALGLMGCNEPDCTACNPKGAPEARTGTDIGAADASKAQTQSTVGVGLAGAPDGVDAFAYTVMGFAEKAQREEASALAKLGEISVQARAQVVGDLTNYIRQQIRSVQGTLSDIEFDGGVQPEGRVEHLQARINHLRNFKALFEAKA